MTQEEGLLPTEPATPEARRHDDHKLEPGTLIDRYKVLRRLGVGGMGVVYEAKDTRLGRLVGLKLVRPHRDGTAEDRLLREAQAMARISHANVLTVYDVGTFEGRLYYAMELVDGGTLREWLRERPRSPRDIAHVFLQAARGLAAAHAMGLVHHDFKPENVLVADDGRVLVADFGLVRLASDERARADDGDPLLGDARQNAVIGTPGYMAPEQILGHPTDARADQFGFCVALCEALYGDIPFRPEMETDVETRVMLMAAMVSGSVRLPGGRQVPGWLRRIILRGLSLYPEDRWPSLDVVATLLERGLRRRQWARLGGAGGVLVASAVAVTVLARGDTTQVEEWRPEVIGVESEGNPARHGAISRDGRMLAFSSRREVWLQPRGTAERVPLRLPAGTFDVFNFALSPDAKRLFLVLAPLQAAETELWRVELPAGKPERVYSRAGRRPLYLDVAADGYTLAIVEKETGGQYRLQLIRPGQQPQALVVPQPAEVLTSPALSPDGRRVAFVRSSPSRSAFVELVDVDTGRLTRVGPATLYGVLDWIDGKTLLAIVDGEDGISRVRELAVDDDGRIRRQRDVYSIPRGVTMWILQATTAGTFMQRGPVDGRVRVATLSLAADGPRPRVLPTGSEVDWQVAGWMPGGDIVIAGRVAGQDAVIVGTEERGFKVAGTFQELGRPLWTMGERVFYSRPGSEPDTRDLLSGGLAPPLSPLARLRPTDHVHCAGRINDPCFLAETVGRETTAYRWDSHTGERGAPVLRWEAYEDYEPGAAAVSHDGQTLAYITPRRSIVTAPLEGGPRTEITPPSAYTYHYVSWTPDGALIAARCCVPYALVRIEADGRSKVVAATGTQWLGNPVVSSDGTTVAVSIKDTEHTYLWVPGPK